MSYLKSFVLGCHENIFSQDSSSFIHGRDYLLNVRGLTNESIKEHSIGISPSYDKLPNQIKFLGESEEDIKNSPKDFSYFIANKIVVPICEEFGFLVGFATRSYISDGTTWWNTPFPKSNHLFLLNKTKKHIFLSNKIYIVEGYMDALLLYHYGIKNVVCIMGTNFSLRQIALTLRYCNNICFCFDTDENGSGQKAQKNSIAMVNRFKSFDDISVINLPKGIDPDKFIIENGKDAFLSLEKVLSPKQIKKMLQAD